MSENPKERNPKPVTYGSQVVYTCYRCKKQDSDAWRMIEHLYLEHDVPVMVEKTTTTTHGF